MCPTRDFFKTVSLIVIAWCAVVITVCMVKMAYFPFDESIDVMRVGENYCRD